MVCFVGVAGSLVISVVFALGLTAGFGFDCRGFMHV